MAKIPEQLKAKLDLIDKILRSGSDKTTQNTKGKDKKQGKDTKGKDTKEMDNKEFIKWITTRPPIDDVARRALMAEAIAKNKLMHTKPAKTHAPSGSDAGPWRWGKFPKGYESDTNDENGHTNFKDDQ